MRALAGHRRTPLVAVTLALVCLAGLAWPVAAQPGNRPPGVPPPVDPTALPTPASVNTLPYLVSTPAAQQIGLPTQQAPCQRPVTSGAQNLATEPAAQRQLRIWEAQEYATGRGQRVAVIDSGVQPHPRLRGRLIDGGDYIENRSGLFDCDGHGTVVAGLIAAAPDARTQFVGVAPAAEILAIRQGSTFYSVPLRQLGTGRQTRSSAGDTRSMAAPVMRAVQLRATVINISEAACFPAEPNQVNAPDLQAAVHYAVEHNVVVVVAAANVSTICQQNRPGVVTTISSPGWFDSDVLTVGATYDDGQPADFSIRGPWVDVAAPGTGAVSLAPGRAGLTAGLLDARGQAYSLSGTSFAAPYVAGLAALVRERFTNLSARQVIHRIERTTRHPAGRRGRNEDVGYGMIDPVAALTAVLPEERGTSTRPVPSTRPAEGSRGTPPPDHLLALAGAAALGALALILVIVRTATRQRRRPVKGAVGLPQRSLDRARHRKT